MMDHDEKFYKSLIAKCKLLGLAEAECRVDGNGLRPAEVDFLAGFAPLGVEEMLYIHQVRKGEWVVILLDGRTMQYHVVWKGKG